MDNINLFSILTIMSFLILAPIAIAVEGVLVTPTLIETLRAEGLLVKAIIASVSFHAYQQISKRSKSLSITSKSFADVEGSF